MCQTLQKVSGKKLVLKAGVMAVLWPGYREVVLCQLKPIEVEPGTALLPALSSWEEERTWFSSISACTGRKDSSTELALVGLSRCETVQYQFTSNKVGHGRMGQKQI